MHIWGVIVVFMAPCMVPEHSYAQDFGPDSEQIDVEQLGVREDSVVAGKVCLETDNIIRYKIESDQLIRFYMEADFDVLMRVKRYCSQLYFHKYISYTPVNGLLCEGVDEVKTRSGLPCRIESIEKIEKKPTEPR